jgi:hypothetical protein
VKFSLTLKLQSSNGRPVVQLVESDVYHVIDDARAKELWSTKIGPVITFHRCVNCHNPGDSPTQGDDRHIHVPPVNRNTTDCRQCHGDTNGPSPGTPPGAPGHWRMPPPAFAFAGKSAEQICRQIKDPAQNGGRSLDALRQHVRTDKIIQWAWNPGPGRTPAPFSWDSIAFNGAFPEWIRVGAACPEPVSRLETIVAGPCCAITANTALTGRMGRLVVAFPAEAATGGTAVTVSKDGKELLSGYGSRNWDLLPGVYEVSISGKQIQNVTVKAGHDTKVRVGALRIVAANDTRAVVIDAGNELTSGYGTQMIGLPVGSFDVQVAGQTEQVVIKEGAVTDF